MSIRARGVRGVIESGVSLNQGFHWIRGLIESEVSLSQRCHWTRGVIESEVSLNQRCHWIRGVIEPWVSLNQGCHRIRGVIEPGVSLNQGSHWIRGLIESGVSLNQGSHWIRGVTCTDAWANFWASAIPFLSPPWGSPFPLPVPQLGGSAAATFKASLHFWSTKLQNASSMASLIQVGRSLAHCRQSLGGILARKAGLLHHWSTTRLCPAFWPRCHPMTGGNGLGKGWRQPRN